MYRRQMRSMNLHGKKIFLTGMPGSGKSTAGKQLAALLSCPFIDLDDEIEKMAGTDIPTIFSTHGEAHFRELERKALLRVTEDPGEAVVATGGGTPCFFDNMDVINKNGISVFIDVSLDELISRLDTAEKSKRPKFSGETALSTRLNELRKERINHYRKAHCHWHSLDQSPDQLLDMIKAEREKRSGTA